MKSKQFDAAKDEFTRVLKDAPGNIDALRGAAQVCIELADDGDPDQYQIADQHLTTALEHGRNQESGSERLQNSEIANLYYMRGYAWTKCYEADAPRTMSIALLNARRDFRKCKEVDSNNDKAHAAIEKINKNLHRHVRESLVEVFGNLAIFLAGAIVFLQT